MMQSSVACVALCPTPRLTAAATLRWQVSWLTALLRLQPGLPGFPVARIGGRLAAYSCGDSHGLDPVIRFAPRSLLLP